MLKKSIAVLTAVAAIASASSVFAADYKDQVVSLTETEKAALDDATAQYTVIIAPKATANGTDAQSDDSTESTTTVTLNAADLLYINQGTAADSFWTNMGVKSALSSDGEYVVRIGSNITGFTVKEYDVTITSQGRTIQLGDCDGITGIDIGDAGAIVSHILKEALLTGDNLIAGDCDGIPGIDIGDAGAVVSHILKESTLGTTIVQ